jgi:hypothetical protein
MAVSHTMSDRVRTSALFLVLLCLAACGGGGGTSSSSCPEGMTSSSSCTSAADLMCTSVMKGTPVSLCSAGKWGPCTCAGGQTSGQSAAGGTAIIASTASCGNGKAEGEEQCDGSDLKGMTCMSLGMGSASAILKCNSRCAFDMLMCFSGGATATGGTGAGGTGARAMTTTTTTGRAGSGGTGH